MVVDPQKKKEMRYRIQTRLNDRAISDDNIADPFVRHTVWIGWNDRVKALFCREWMIEVIITADRELENQVLALSVDPQPNKDEFREWLDHRLTLADRAVAQLEKLSSFAPCTLATYEAQRSALVEVKHHLNKVTDQRKQ